MLSALSARRLSGALAVLVWVGMFCPGPVQGSGRTLLLLREGSGTLAVDRSALAERIRKDLGLPFGTRIDVGPLPRHIHGPDGRDVTAEIARQGPLNGGRYLYRLNLLQGGVARESFFLRVRVMRGPRGKAPGHLSAGRRALEGPMGEGALVQSGDTVRVTVQGPGFRIRFAGISEGGGDAGDRILIVNPASGRSLSGEVTGRDSVTVRLKERS